MNILVLLSSLFFLLRIENTEIKVSKSLDSNSVIELNNESASLKFTNPHKALLTSKEAAKIAESINYKDGLAESNRLTGVNFSYIGKRDSSIVYFYKSLNIFKEIGSKSGEAKTLNNLGNIYNNYDNEKALQFYQQALDIGLKEKILDLTAGCFLNIGNINNRKKNYELAIFNYQKSNKIFNSINNLSGISQTLQGLGVSYYYKKENSTAEGYLLKAYQIAKKENFKTLIASINQTLARIAIEKKDFLNAEIYIIEGKAIAHEFTDDLLIYDYTLCSYYLELGKKNYQEALKHLKEVNSKDSIYYKDNIANILELSSEQQRNIEKQKDYELTAEKQKKTQILFIASTILATLSFIFIFLLMRNKKQLEKSNHALILLNEEVSTQKSNLDKLNSRLEEIIAERTKDLTSKNQKLSEYSSHLSHQVRGPVATLKGLIMLSQENLIQEKECIIQMRKCIEDIDEQIMDINIALHDTERVGLSKKT